MENNNIFASVNTGKSLPEKIADEIITLIANEKLQVGDKLPSEAELVRRLNVGRSSLREAIKFLVSRNIIEIRRGLGTYVSEKMGVIEDPLGFTFVKDKKKLLLDVLDVRYMIEPNIAAKAAEMATDEQVEEILKLCNEVEEMILCGENHIEKDIALHTLIAESSQNMVVSTLLPIINQSIYLFGNVTECALKNETISTHRGVVEGICERNPQKAKENMAKHIIYNKNLIEKL